MNSLPVSAARSGRELLFSWARAPFVVLLGAWVIQENESGLVVKQFGPSLPPGRLIALEGEAGYQADAVAGVALRLLAVAVPIVRGFPWSSSGPGRSRWSWRRTARPSHPSAFWADVACDNFQDARKFLARRREGTPAGILTAGTYRINLALFTVITSANAAEHGMGRSKLHLPASSRTWWAS